VQAELRRPEVLERMIEFQSANCELRLRAERLGALAND
jgi:hypothetical protein